MLYPTTRRPVNTAGDLFNSRLGRVFEEALQHWASPEGGSLTSAWWPACDVFEDKDSIKIIVEVPGVKPEDVKLSLENNLLTIRGEKRQAAEEQAERVHRYERSYGSFERTFALPSTVDPDRIQAAVEHGILTVTLPKADRAKPREIVVKAS